MVKFFIYFVRVILVSNEFRKRKCLIFIKEVFINTPATFKISEIMIKINDTWHSKILPGNEMFSKFSSELTLQLQKYHLKLNKDNNALMPLSFQHPQTYF